MVLRLLQILIRQRVCIHNHNRLTMIERKMVIIMRLRMIEMTTECTYLEGRGIHSHNNIGLVTWGVHLIT